MISKENMVTIAEPETYAVEFLSDPPSRDTPLGVANGVDILRDVVEGVLHVTDDLQRVTTNAGIYTVGELVHTYGQLHIRREKLASQIIGFANHFIFSGE